jgi:hypothetical protein
MMEAVSSSEPSANIFQTTRQYIPEDRQLLLWQQRERQEISCNIYRLAMQNVSHNTTEMLKAKLIKILDSNSHTYTFARNRILDTD